MASDKQKFLLPHTAEENPHIVSSKPEETELRSLLSSWNLAQLAEEFIAQNVFVNILKIIKRDHIERLLKNFDMGTLILFEHNLEEWRVSIGLPFGPPRTTTESLSYHRNRKNSPSPTFSSGSLGAGTPSPSRFMPYESPSTDDVQTSNDACQLYVILNETSRGNMLVQYYNKFSKFHEDQRSTLIALIALYFQEKGIKMTLGASHQIERQILERFPSEKLEYYRTSKRGKIYTKFCNLKTSFNSAVSKHVLEGKKRETEQNKSRHEGDFVPEEDAENCLRALKFDDLTSEQFDNTWKACCQFRLQFIKSNNTAEIMYKWPFYKTPSGYRLIDMDFKASFENKDGLLTKWEHSRDEILSFLKIDNHIKDHNVKQLMDKLNCNTTLITENGRNAAIVWALQGYLVPTTKVVKKDPTTGKKSTTKFTIKDAQESIIFVGQNMQQIEDRMEYLKKTKISIQPSIYCIGEDILSVQEIFLNFDDIRYTFTNVLRALDICFKIMYLFNLEFPAESTMFYSFIETNFFELKSTNSMNSKVHILCGHLLEKSV